MSNKYVNKTTGTRGKVKYPVSSLRMPPRDRQGTHDEGDLASLEARLRSLTSEEFASLVYRLTMRAGGVSPKGALVVVHWGTRADVHVLLPVTDDPAAAQEVLEEMKSGAEDAVGDLLCPKLDA